MIQMKICIVGAFGVGKTSLISRYAQGIFSDKYKTTVGVKIDKKVLEHNGNSVTLILWDLEGEDALTSVRPAHLRGASGYVLVIDGSRRNTLEVGIDLQQRVERATGPVPFVCVINKADLKDSWEIDPSDIEALERRHWILIETSAKTGTAVEQVFQRLADAILREQDVAKYGTSALAG